MDEHTTLVEEAIRCDNSDECAASMQREYDDLMENNTWTLMPLPFVKSVIPCRWVFKIKPATRAESKVFKSRLAVKGFRQVFGVDYDGTYALVLRMSAIRVLLSIAVNEKMHVHGMDAKNSFLNGELENEVFMEQPFGFLEDEFPHNVCKLWKVVYGLKKSPRQWYNTIRQSVGVDPSPSDSGVQ